MVRFLFAKDPSDCHVEKGWEKGAERETRQEAVLVTLARGCGGRNWKGDSEEGQMSMELRDTWVLVWLWRGEREVKGDVYNSKREKRARRSWPAEFSPWRTGNVYMTAEWGCPTGPGHSGQDWRALGRHWCKQQATHPEYFFGIFPHIFTLKTFKYIENLLQ